ncbi:serine/threonine-protein kinase/endoribonuclease IRE2-like [Xenia sp. Carnegie-2017]|uniref:serine/threonine-protein kinase/endoribonuclease IRE2-like n=1 Tax=Xenia sp. Carnegie-2017 TaxID=2897299 RepID=UPI001F045E07|nr:serine/threonine-protein kinase/endoribonuclease IRE2-like [Xenia sp. Carnegie-2017]
MCELVLQEWKYIDESAKHRELFLKLIEYGRNSSVEVKEVGNVRVIFSKEFCIGEGSGATRVYLGLEEDTGTEYVYLILDLCEESLESYVKSTLEDLQKVLPKILRQILRGLADLHSGENPIVHRDLKPSNVLRDTKGNFLIADFGISRILKKGSTTHNSSPNKGTEYWIAPESYIEDEDSFDKARYKRSSDVYVSVEILDNMLNGNPVGLKEIKDETLKDLLSWMLNLKPENRPSASEALKHPFLISDHEKFDLLCNVGNPQN